MQIFPRAINAVTRAALALAVALIVAVPTAVTMVQRSSYATGVGVPRQQPIAFSHKHHSGDVGLDCRYCHTSVERSPFAGMPSTDTCMNCHRQLWNESGMLEPVRASYRSGASNRVDARVRPPRLRLLRSLHSCGEGRGLLDVSRPHRCDAPHLACHHARDALVSRLSPPSRALRATARAGLRHDVRATGRSAGAGPAARPGLRHPEQDELLDVSSLRAM